jgi:hypothetical protein
MVALDPTPRTNGYVVVRDDTAAVLGSAERAEALLERLGFPSVDRYIRHLCR